MLYRLAYFHVEAGRSEKQAIAVFASTQLSGTTNGLGSGSAFAWLLIASAILSTFSGFFSSVPIAANSNLSSIRSIVIYHLTAYYGIKERINTNATIT